MDSDPRPMLADAGADLEHLKADRIELRPGPGGVGEMMPPQGVFQDGGTRRSRGPDHAPSSKAASIFFPGCFLLPGFAKCIVDQYVRRGNSFFYE
jgi:hypothetical protein